MGRQVWVIVVTAWLILSVSATARADLFEDALEALTNDNLNAAAFDSLGRSLRGGLAAGYPQLPAGTPLLNDFSIATPCGAFSFGDGLIDNLAGLLDPSRLESLVAGLQQSVQSLIGAAISSLPMVTACYAAPTLCDIVKHVQDMVNQIFQFKGLSCQQAETLLAGIGGRLSGARTSRCISQQQRAGSTLAAAEQACRTRSAPGIRDARTGREVAAGRSTDLIRDTLKRGQDNLGHGNPDTDAGMIDVQTFAEDVLGRFELKRGATDDEPLDVDITPPTRRIHDIYRTERRQLGSTIDDAAEIAGNPAATLSTDKHREVSLPGLAMPHGVLRALYDIKQVDAAAYAGYRDKLAGNFTMLALSWRVGELRDLLEAGMLDNTELSEAEADIIKARLERLERERDRFISEKELMERHAVPVLQAILQDHRERKQAARDMMAGAGVDTATTANRFGAQHPLGYGY